MDGFRASRARPAPSPLFPQSCGDWSPVPPTPNLSFSSPFWESRLGGGLLPAPLTSLSELPTKALRGLQREGPPPPGT